jgi:hypothetical protein
VYCSELPTISVYVDKMCKENGFTLMITELTTGTDIFTWNITDKNESNRNIVELAFIVHTRKRDRATFYQGENCVITIALMSLACAIVIIGFITSVITCYYAKNNIRLAAACDQQH